MDLIEHFDKLKISAFSKYEKIGEQIHNVTIGPNSVKKTVEKKSLTPGTSRKVSSSRQQEPTSPQQHKQDNSTVHLLRHLDSKRKVDVQEAINKRLHTFCEFSKQQAQEKQLEWVSHWQDIIKNYQQQERNIMQQIEAPTATGYNRNEKMVQHFQRKAIIEQQIEENREKNRIMRGRLEEILKGQQEFRKNYQEIVPFLSSENVKNELDAHHKSLLKVLPTVVEDVLKHAIARTITDENLQKIQSANNQLINLKSKIQEIIERNNKKIEEKRAQVAEEEKNRKIIEENFEQFIHPINLKHYEEIMNFLSKSRESFKELLADERLKNFRFECKKAVNTPVNAISAVNGGHLRDKYNKLFNLLSGKNVTIGDSYFNASSHPQGINFCKDLLAKQFVRQGDLLISSNPDAAFAYATIILTLWKDFPDFGKILLGYFYLQCPYLVPYYIPKTEDLTTEEHYQKLGYNYINGQIEKQDKFLKRMTGILRLYFSLFVSKPKRNSGESPIKLGTAYRWLASISRLEPQLDITATCLHTFLEIVGFEMENKYGRVFKKILRIIKEVYLPEIKKIDSGGPVSRLEVLLQDYYKQGYLGKPTAMLPDNFW